jgi:hypothetical protein
VCGGERKSGCEGGPALQLSGMQRVWNWSANDAQASVPKNNFGYCALKDRSSGVVRGSDWKSPAALITVLLRARGGKKAVEISKCGEVLRIPTTVKAEIASRD